MEVIIVRHDELMLKGRLFPSLENQLIKDIENAFSKEGVTISIRRERGRIYIYPDNLHKASSILKRVFGVHSFFIAEELNSYEELKNSLLSFDKGKVYKIVVKRANKKFPGTSMEVAKELALFLESNGFKTGVKRFDRIIRVEIRDKFYVVKELVNGPGGFPRGFGDKAVLLFSGGLDSSVALYLASRQGIRVIPLLVSPTYEIKEKVSKVLEKLNQLYYLDYSLVSFSLPKEIMYIREEIRQVAFKRFLYLLAEKTAKKEGASAIITGEVIGQTHSQRLENLRLIEKDISFPVIRPLAFMSKNRIMEIAREIGIYEESSSIEEFCILAKRVKTHVKEKEMEEIEESLRDMLNSLNEPRLSKSKGEGGKRVVLYLDREEDLKKVLNHDLDKNKKYLLVCKTGTTASFLAEELRRHGFDAIGKRE